MADGGLSVTLTRHCHVTRCIFLEKELLVTCLTCVEWYAMGFTERHLESVLSFRRQTFSGVRRESDPALSKMKVDQQVVHSECVYTALSPTHPNNFDYYPMKDKVTEWVCSFEYKKPLAQTCHMIRVRDEQHFHMLTHTKSILCTLVNIEFTQALSLMQSESKANNTHLIA